MLTVFSTPTAFTCLMIKVAKPKVNGSIENGNITSEFTMNNHNIPACVWKVKVEVLKWFLVCTVACTGVCVVYIQWTHIWMLRAEMSEITERFRPLETAGTEGGIYCYSAVCYGVGECFHSCAILTA